MSKNHLTIHVFQTSLTDIIPHSHFTKINPNWSLESDEITQLRTTCGLRLTVLEIDKTDEYLNR